MDVKRVTENLFYPTNESLKNLQKILALDKKIFFFVMGIGVIIYYDHHFQAKQAKVTATFLHSCLREKAEHRCIPSLKPLWFASFCIKRIGFQEGRGCNYISPWKEVVIRFLSRSTSSVLGKTRKRTWKCFPLAGKRAQASWHRLVWKALAERAMHVSVAPDLW